VRRQGFCRLAAFLPWARYPFKNGCSGFASETQGTTQTPAFGVSHAGFPAPRMMRILVGGGRDVVYWSSQRLARRATPGSGRGVFWHATDLFSKQSVSCAVCCPRVSVHMPRQFVAQGLRVRNVSHLQTTSCVGDSRGLHFFGPAPVPDRFAKGRVHEIGRKQVQAPSAWPLFRKMY